MRFGSVCSGIEAASVAFAPLGWEAAWFSEIEPFPRAVLRHHYPSVANLGDMTTLPALVRAGLVEAPDVLCGGTPCQAFSVAGKRESLDDERGNLSLIFCRLANAIDDSRPDAPPVVILWENVPGVLNTHDNAFGCFLAELAGEDDALWPTPDRSGTKWSNAGAVFGPRRTVAWRTLDAQYFGLAQRRRRVFVVASAREDFDPLAVLFERDGVRRDTAPSRSARQDAAGRAEQGSEFGCGGIGEFSAVDAAPPIRRTGADGGHGYEVLQTTAFGGNNTAGPIDAAAALNANRGCHNPGDFEAGTLLTVAFDTTQITSPTNRCNPQAGDPCRPLAAGAHPPAIAFSGKDYGADATLELSPTLRAMNHAQSHANGGGQMAVAFNARQDPDTWVERARPLDTDGGTQAVAVTGDIAHCLNTANNGKGCSEDGTGRGVPTVATSMQVRRLTPVECERLQGFPDDYTNVPHRGKPAADGPRYKALGNSWAVPVVAWIGRRIVRALNA